MCVRAVMPLKQLDVNDTALAHVSVCVCVRTRVLCASLNVSLSDHICPLNVNEISGIPHRQEGMELLWDLCVCVCVCVCV